MKQNVSNQQIQESLMHLNQVEIWELIFHGQMSRRTSTRTAEDPGEPLGGDGHHLKPILWQIKTTQNFLLRLQPHEEGRKTVM